MNTPVLEVNLTALAGNYRLLKSTLNGRLTAAVVKANAYGLGVEAVSRTLWEEGCRHFFVATLAEALQLRNTLPEAQQIYIFQGIFSGEEKEISQHKLIPVLNSMEHVALWEKAAGGAPSVLHIDTGMTRLGLNETEALRLVADVDMIRRAGIQCIMSHLACGNDPADPKNAEQLARFKKALALFPPSMTASFANSSGIFLGREYHYDMARPGCALYGINPTNGKNPMRHVATLSAPLLQIRELDRDETVGYGATHAVLKGGRIAIVALGYADGMLRHLSNKGCAYVEGHKAPIIGRVSMDMIALDVSAIPASVISAQSHAEFINEAQDVNAVADLSETIGYEIFTRIGSRVKRVYSSQLPDAGCQ